MDKADTTENCSLSVPEPAAADDNVLNKSVGKTLMILSTFDEKTPMQRTKDIATRLHMNISTVSRHLNTLLDCGFLERDDETGFYYPGLKVIALAGVALQNNDVYRYALAELSKLTQQYNVHGHMAIPRAPEIVHLLSCACENTVEQLTPMGHRNPMYCSAMGRVILAYMPTATARDIVKNSNRIRYASETKTDLDEIMAELQLVKKQGYSLICNELNDGAATLAAPIFNRKRIPVAAISVASSTQKFRQPEYVKEIALAVKSTANIISRRLGYFPW